MHTRWFVYDVSGQLEEFVASFASYSDALSFGKAKFGNNLYITDVAHHDKVKLGVAKKVRRSARPASSPNPRSWGR